MATGITSVVALAPSGWLGGDARVDAIATVAVVAAVWLLRRVFVRVTASRLKDAASAYRWRKLSGWVATTLVLLAVVAIWLDAFRSVSTFLGLLAAGLAVALRDPIVNLAGWMFIVWRRPFEVGDRIQIGEYAGDVVDLRVFQFSLMEIGGWVDAEQQTGRIVHVSNAKVFSENVANYSKPFQFIWDEIPVLVTFESDWQKAKAILEEIATQHSERFSAGAEQAVVAAARRLMLPASQLTARVYTSTRDSGVLLTIRYLVEPRRRRESEHLIWEDVLRAFSPHADIDFAYPTQRFYDNVLESKERAEVHGAPGGIAPVADDDAPGGRSSG